MLLQLGRDEYVMLFSGAMAQYLRPFAQRSLGYQLLDHWLAALGRQDAQIDGAVADEFLA